MNLVVMGLVALALFAGGGWAGWQAANDRRDAIELAEFKGKSEALEATAAAIAKLDIKQVTIRQQAETIIREKEVYRECRNTPEMMKVLNDAAKGGQP